MKIFRACLLLTVLTQMLMSSCVRNSLDDAELISLSISASGHQTRTYMSEGHTKWINGDVIWVFSEDGIRKMSSSCEEEGASFQFVVNEWPAGETPEYAVYAGNASTLPAPSMLSSGINLNLNCNQKISHPSSFDDLANVSIGRLVKTRGKEYSVKMKNVCGLLCFSFSRYDDIMSVMFEDLNGADMAGLLSVTLNDDGNPVAETVDGAGERYLKVSANGNTESLGNVDGELPKGLQYYVCILPGTYRMQVTITRRTGERLVLKARSDIEVLRNGCVSLGDIDAAAQELWEVSHESFSLADEWVNTADLIDFSRVGYHWGDESPANVPVAVDLVPGEGDMTETIQKAIDETAPGYAVLLKEGTYEVAGQLLMKSGVVLRGEGPDRTVILATGNSRYEDPSLPENERVDRSLITMGQTVKRKYSAESAVVEDARRGQLYVRVDDPGKLKAGDEVAVCRPGTYDWLDDLHMTEIPQNEEGKVKTWDRETYYDYYTLHWSRKVVKVSGDCVWLDNPLAMELTGAYGEENRGKLRLVNSSRVSECGIEDLCLESSYNKNERNGDGKYIDEDHCWTAVTIKAAEHCWVRNVTARHFAYCAVNLLDGARYITVSNCRSESPVSKITGSRRYAFHNYKGEMSIFTDCTADCDRHGFVTGVMTPGPNVFRNCVMTNAISDMGPHQRWATGVLYDCCRTDGILAVQDRDNWGTGQGWAGVNFVFWNCEAKTLICQSPWVTGLNWCIGCIGDKINSSRDYETLGDRPDGEWRSHGVHVAPMSLYDAQLQMRIKEGVKVL